MNSDHTTDLSPLSYGAGLTLGLFLILGLPAERNPRGSPRPGASDETGRRNADPRRDTIAAPADLPPRPATADLL